MGWVEQLEGHTVALDTAPLISFIAREAPYADLLRALFGAIADGKIIAVTLTVTLVEVLVRPLRENNAELAMQYRDILTHSANLTAFPLSDEIALRAAELRARLNLRTPDAIQVATALVAGADTFITNDKHLRVPNELKRIVVDDLLISVSET
ncbi:MAG: PIN domain-containing protein [Chloroflexota bacterium]|nr:MAG: PIN domain-containing protein [Chloroflexota bacterium]